MTMIEIWDATITRVVEQGEAILLAITTPEWKGGDPVQVLQVHRSRVIDRLRDSPEMLLNQTVYVLHLDCVVVAMRQMDAVGGPNGTEIVKMSLGKFQG